MPNLSPNATIALNDGKRIPQLGFGVWQVDNDEVAAPVRVALDAGYRLIDTAQGYDNEAGVGRAIRESGLPRDQLFVTSKIRTRSHGFDAALKGYDESLKAMGLDRLDLFLIHWPTPARDNFVDTWKAFVRLREDGRVGSIGVSNFLPEHIERIVGDTGVTPAINQIETHPQFQQRDVRDFHRQHGIQLEAYSPLGSGAVLDNEVIEHLAAAHGRSPAQIIIRWHLQEGRVVIPKSVTPDRIRQNRQVFDFELNDHEMAAIAGLDRKNGRTGSDPATFNDLY
jgi:2,5-diketo-D-gluconate reductase A